MKTIKYVFVILFITTFLPQINAQRMTKQKDTKVLIKTTMGDMTAILYAGTPYHSANFIKLVNEKYYDGLLFHRVIESFMIQGGDPESKNAKPGQQLGSGGPGYTVGAEITPKYFHKKGALSAARTGDQMNPTRRSSGSQFYIVTGKVYSEAELEKMAKMSHTVFTDEQKKAYTTIGGTPFLDGQYTVFGEIIDGIEVAVAISKVQKNRSDRPEKDVKIISMKIIK